MINLVTRGLGSTRLVTRGLGIASGAPPAVEIPYADVLLYLPPFRRRRMSALYASTSGAPGTPDPGRVRVDDY